jgi:hypothetical protein
VNREGNKISITPEDFKRFWQRVNKFVSSSMPGVHYGHYKVAIQDETSSALLALLCRVKMLMQHYHTSTNLSRKLDASLQCLQLQLGMSHNLLLLNYDTRGHLAPLSWVKMLWWMLNHFDIHLHMSYPTIPLPQERDRVIMEIFLSAGLGSDLIRSLGRCRVAHEALFLSDLTTAVGKYLKDFVFAPGRKERASTFKFPRERPSQSNWESWFNFWHRFTTTGDKLKVPLGPWISPTHRIWKWYYRADIDELQRVEGSTIFYYKQSSAFRVTRATRLYHVVREEPLLPTFIQSTPTSITGPTIQRVVKLSKGPVLAKALNGRQDFWEFLYSWGGQWMWEGIEAGKGSPYDMSLVVEGMKNNTLLCYGSRTVHTTGKRQLT